MRKPYMAATVLCKLHGLQKKIQLLKKIANYTVCIWKKKNEILSIEFGGFANSKFFRIAQRNSFYSQKDGETVGPTAGHIDERQRV